MRDLPAFSAAFCPHAERCIDALRCLGDEDACPYYGRLQPALWRFVYETLSELRDELVTFRSRDR